MLLDLTFTTTKWICTQLKTDVNNTNFTKLDAGYHIGFNDTAWNYWVFNTYTEMCNAFPDRVSSEFPCEYGMIPPEEFM